MSDAVCIDVVSILGDTRRVVELQNLASKIGRCPPADDFAWTAVPVSLGKGAIGVLLFEPIDQRTVSNIAAVCHPVRDPMSDAAVVDPVAGACCRYSDDGIPNRSWIEASWLPCTFRECVYLKGRQRLKSGNPCGHAAVRIWVWYPMTHQRTIYKVGRTCIPVSHDGVRRFGDRAGLVCSHRQRAHLIGGDVVDDLFAPPRGEAQVRATVRDLVGETVKTIVVAHPGRTTGEADLIDFARTRLAKYKYPTSIEFAPVLPRNASGKVLKKELRRLYRPSNEPVIS